MNKTSGEIEKEFIEGLKATTGKDLSLWLSEVKKSGKEKRNDVIEWLKKDKKFLHTGASLLAGIFFNGGKPVYGNSDELLGNQFKGKESLLGLYNSLIEFITKNFPQATVIPKKTYISVTEKREFIAINVKAEELRVGFDLGQMPFTKDVQKSKLTGPMPRLSHMIILKTDKQLNKELKTLMDKSFARCN